MPEENLPPTQTSAEQDLGAAQAPADEGKKPEKPVFEKPKVLFSWQSPSREFSPKSPLYFTTLFVLTLLAVVLLSLVREYTLGLVVAAVGFVLFALNRYEPELVDYELLNVGLTIQKKEYRWDKFRSFFIQEKPQYDILWLKTWLAFPGAMAMLFPADQKGKFEEELLKHLDYEEFKTGDAKAYLDDVVESFPFNPDAPAPRAVRSFFNRIFRRKR